MAAIAEWDNDYARLARAASQLRTTGLPAGGAAGAQQAAALSQGCLRLEASLRTLPVSASEMHRRQRLIQHLQQTSGGGVVDLLSSSNPETTTQQPSQMMQAMQQQDLMIDQLAVGVGRLKNQTAAISDESRLHVNLLNDMEVSSVIRGLIESLKLSYSPRIYCYLESLGLGPIGIGKRNPAGGAPTRRSIHLAVAIDRGRLVHSARLAHFSRIDGVISCWDQL
jgi:hypothetical protein